MSIRSYVRSTDSHCESRSQNIFPSIDISIDAFCTAARTVPTANIERQLIHYKPTMVTSFTRRKKAVNFDQCSPVPLTLILKLAKHLRPSSIANITNQLMVFDHISNRQVFNSYQAIFSDQAECQLVQKIGTGIFDESVYSSYFESRLISVFRA